MRLRRCPVSTGRRMLRTIERADFMDYPYAVTIVIIVSFSNFSFHLLSTQRSCRLAAPLSPRGASMPHIPRRSFLQGALAVLPAAAFAQTANVAFAAKPVRVPNGVDREG